ncbi:hypothetical protein VaNZ11_016522, partial [Volvox africanus]
SSSHYFYVDEFEKKPWKKLWNKESWAAWRSFKYAQPDNPDAGPSERRIVMEDLNVTDRQQELINTLVQRKQIESSKTSFAVPATPVPVGAGGTAQHTPGLGALELPKGTTVRCDYACVHFNYCCCFATIIVRTS